MNRFSPKLEVLPPSQRALYPFLRGSSGLGLVLYGGTAIGLRLGHRHSVDFDFFTDRRLDRERLAQAFPFLANATVLQEQPETLTVLTPLPFLSGNSVKVSFFGGLGFGRSEDPELTDDGVLEVASLPDLIATKLKVILQRIEAKDYQDIAAMLRAGISLDRALAAARIMYAPAFQPSESLKALTYFRGGDLDELSLRDRETIVEAVRQVRDLPHITMAGTSLSIIGSS